MWQQRETYIGDITNAEIARAFGADLILLNCVDVLEPDIYSLERQRIILFRNYIVW